MGKKTRFKKSNYKIQLREKQKVKRFYGVGEKQFRNFFYKAAQRKGVTGENLLVLCERRLDNIVWRAGLCRTRAQSRQAVAHGHMTVNGRKTDVPSYLVRPGDTIQVRGRESLQKLYTKLIQEVDRPEAPFLAVEEKDLLVKVIRLPEIDEVGLPISNMNIVVEFLSR